MTFGARRVGAVVVVAAILAITPGAAAASLVADWGMNEKLGSTMHDLSGHRHRGTIGSDVVVGRPAPDGTRAYRFQGDPAVVDTERLVRVPDADDLDPGASTFTVTLRIRTRSYDANMTQKGQARSPGGFWKFELHSGWLRCSFRDADGQDLAVGFVGDKRPETKVDDGTWHTVSCARTATGARVMVDGIAKTRTGELGSVSNQAPLVLGGKLGCNGTTVSCDYFAGLTNWMRIRKS